MLLCGRVRRVVPRDPLMLRDPSLPDPTFAAVDSEDLLEGTNRFNYVGMCLTLAYGFL